MNSFVYLLRREIWEHRAFVMVPMVMAAIYLIGNLFGLFELARVSVDGSNYFQLEELIEELEWADPEERSALMGFIMAMYAMPFFIVLGFLVFFYLLDALYSDRRDRSILFWKSLPITDSATVASKIVTATLIAPLLTLGWVFAAHVSTLMVLTIVAWMGGGSAWELVWSPMPFIDIYLLYLYITFTGALWYAPVWGWLLLASAWARKAVFLWATVPIVGIGILEEWFLDSGRWFYMLAYRFGYYPWAAFNDDAGIGVEGSGSSFDVQGELLDVLAPGRFFSNPDLYAGLVTAAVFVAGAIWLRRYRDET